MKRILAFFLLLTPLLAAAVPVSNIGDAGWSELTTSQQAEILAAVATASELNSKESAVTTPESVDAWVDVGERIGKMLNGAAREVGMALSTFIATPAGKVALALIVWKVAGTAIVHLVGAFVVWGFGAVVMIALYRRFSRVEITYHPELKNRFGRPLKTKEVVAKMTSDESWGIFLGSVAFTLAGLLVLLTI